MDRLVKCRTCDEVEYMSDLNLCVACEYKYCHDCSEWVCNPEDETDGEYMCLECIDEEIRRDEELNIGGQS